MNYDTSISTEVSLSKVLDEMILDGTDLEIIVTFLESHESQIEDIYRHSAFVYDLYDLAAHPYRINDFLVSHIGSLPSADMCFAAESLMNFLVQEDYRGDLVSTLRNVLKGNADVIRFRSAGYKGRFLDDVAIASGDRDFVKFMDSISADKRDVRTMLQESYLARSMLMYGNFVRFDTRTQFFILTSLVDILSDKYRSKRQNHQFLVGATNNLLKQMLVANDTEAFNWVVNVMQIGGSYASAAMYSDLYARIPKSIGDAFGKTLNTFEETVFEMNMVETQFDVLDLFMLIYLFNGKLFKGMKENVELLEFFNLPFKWEELERFRAND